MVYRLCAAALAAQLLVGAPRHSVAPNVAQARIEGGVCYGICGAYAMRAMDSPGGNSQQPAENGHAAGGDHVGPCGGEWLTDFELPITQSCCQENPPTLSTGERACVCPMAVTCSGMTVLRRSVPSLNFSDLVANLGPLNRDLQAGRTFALCLQYSRSASNTFKFPKRYADLLPPAFRQARFVTAWRKPRKLGGILRYRLNAVSTSPLVHTDGSADTDRESVSSPVHDESEGSGDDFFQATRFFDTPSDTGRSSASDSND